jgi:malate synthase
MNQMDDTIHADYAGDRMKAGAVREGRAGVTGRWIATVSGTNVVRHVYDGMHVIADGNVQNISHIGLRQILV